MPTTYSTGTVSIGAGSTTLTGAGTSWLTSGVRAGDRLELAGMVTRIATVVSNTGITLARAWPGSAQSGADYDIALEDDNVRSLVAANALLQTLGAGTLTSLGALSGGANKMPYWTGSGVMASTDLTAEARALIGSSLIGRSADNIVTAVAARITGGAVTQSHVDTTAGRLIKVDDFGIGATAAGVPGNDLDDIATFGSYLITSAVIAGSPALSGIALSSGSTLLHFQYNNDNASQILCARSTNRIYVRNKGIGTWGSFVQIYNADNLPIEQGNNANGRYIRLADGTQICWRTMSASSGGATSWTFPAVFSATPTISGSAIATVLSAICLDAAPTTTAASFSARDSGNARRADSCHLVATGRWI